jgi:GNAT superfamily N-acetyltransferase
MRAEPTITSATRADAAEVLVLQRCCWVTEAIVNGTLEIPALHEELDDVLGWIDTAWTVRDGGRLIGGVRASAADRAWHIGRLMVAPDRRGEGLGGRLLRHAEAQAPSGTERFALFTGRRSDRNLAMYERAGYRRVGGDDAVVHLEKARP